MRLTGVCFQCVHFGCSAMNSHKIYKYPRGITKVAKTSICLACFDVAADMGMEASAVVDRKLEVLELPDECVVEFPDEGPVVDEFGVGSAVVDRKLEVLGLPDECVVELPDEGPVVDEFGVGSAVVERKLEVLELPDECVVELPGEGPVVDEFGVGSAVVERKLEVPC